MPKHRSCPSILLGKALSSVIGGLLIAGILVTPFFPANSHEAVIAMLEKRGSVAEVGSWLQSVLVSPAQAATGGEFKGPTKPKGISVKNLGKFDLGKELKGMDGRDVRVRLWTMKEGGDRAGP